MAYYGNLALQPQRKPEQTPKGAQEREKVLRRRPLPIGEKLLYLFTLVVCAIVAGFIVYRYAEIYQMNREIQEINRQYEQKAEQLKELQREAERLSDPKRIIDEAKNKLGMVQLDPSRSITIVDKGGAVAMYAGN
jgi:cell division protein FtsL